MQHSFYPSWSTCRLGSEWVIRTRMRACQQKRKETRHGKDSYNDASQNRVHAEKVQRELSVSQRQEMLPDPGFEAHAGAYTGQGLVTSLSRSWGGLHS